jgi:hypothetical protein
VKSDSRSVLENAFPLAKGPLWPNCTMS